MLPFKIFPGMLASAKIFFTASCATVDVATPLPHATKYFYFICHNFYPPNISLLVVFRFATNS